MKIYEKLSFIYFYCIFFILIFFNNILRKSNDFYELNGSS